MRLPRLTLRLCLVMVAVMAAAMWRFADVYVKRPAQQRLFRIAGYHEIREGGWRFIADGFDGDPQHQSKIDECRRIAAWHKKRIAELYSDGVPSAESWWDEGQRMNEYEFQYQTRLGASGFLRETYRSYRP